jgi:glucoamylase
LLAAATVHWSVDGWKTAIDTRTHDTKLGVHVVDLPTEKLPVGHTVVFTFHWTHPDRWEGTDYSVVVE